MRRLIVASVIVMAASVLPAPARAEHGSPAEPPASPPAPPSDFNVDFDLKLESDGFRVGGRLFGLGGVWGAWLNGQRRPDGFTLDGRLQHPERSFNFKFDTDLPDWLLLLMPPSRNVI